MDIEQQVADFRVAVEGRLTAIEGKLIAVGTSVDHWAEHTRRQNHRIDVIESWIADRVKDMAHAAGVLQGREQLRKRDLAVLAGIVGTITAISSMATHAADIIRLVSG